MPIRKYRNRFKKEESSSVSKLRDEDISGKAEVSPIELLYKYFGNSISESDGCYLYRGKPISLKEIYAIINHYRRSHGIPLLYVPTFYR